MITNLKRCDRKKWQDEETMPNMYGEEEDIGLTQDDIDRPLTVLDIVRLLSTKTNQSTHPLSHH